MLLNLAKTGVSGYGGKCLYMLQMYEMVGYGTLSKGEGEEGILTFDF
ncbi:MULTISPECIES: hypothetical protein [Aerosakkonema]